MINRIVIAGLVLLFPLFAASAQKEPPPTPSISLNTYGQTEWTQDAQEPLLLAVGLGNPEASQIDAENRDAIVRREAFRRSGVLETMPEEEAQRIMKSIAAKPVPVFTVGSKGKAPASLIRWTATDAAGKPVQIKIRELALNSKAPAVLNGRSPSVFHFGVDPETLQSLPEGEYFFQAVLDTAKEKGMWSGKIESAKVKIHLKKKVDGLTPKDLLLLNYFYGRFYLLDEQYSKVETYVLKLLAADSNSVTAWELRGDAMAGTGDLVRAEAAFRQALTNFDKKHAGKQVEPPDYLIRRYNEVRAGKP